MAKSKIIKKRIAVIGLKGLPAYGGAATVGENIIEQLKSKYDFTVYSVSSHTNLKSGKYNGYKQVVIKQIKLKKLNTLLYYIKSMIYVFFNNFDLIHLHHRDAAFIIPILRLKYKVILTTHGMELTDKWKQYKNLFNSQDKVFLGLANVITSVSLKDKRIVENILKKEDVVYIPNGANATFEIKNRDNDTLVFAAGRIVPNKGCHVLIEALIKLNYKGEVIIIGDLSQMLEYNKEIMSISKKIENIKFTGLIKDKNKLYEYLNSAKLFIYPSEIESMSMMMLEVASFKTPLICADIPENKDIFNENELLYFDKGNSEDLKMKIEWALSNYLLMQKKAQKAYDKLQRDYQWADIAEKYSKVYNSLI